MTPQLNGATRVTYVVAWAGVATAPMASAPNLTLDVQPAATAPAAAPSTPPAPGASGPAPPAPQASAHAAPATTAAKPQNLDKPRLTRSRKSLACSPGRWSNDPSGYEYGWLVDGRPVRGATGPKLAVRARTHGHKVACSVTASNTAGATTSVSRALRVP